MPFDTLPDQTQEKYRELESKLGENQKKSFSSITTMPLAVTASRESQDTFPAYTSNNVRENIPYIAQPALQATVYQIIEVTCSEFTRV